MWVIRRACHHLRYEKKSTCIVLLLEFDPVLKDHFELFVDEVMGESVSSGFVLNEIVFSGITFFHGSVEVDTVPEDE